jgi:superoxide reductase
MERRDLIRLGLTGVVAGAVLPQRLLAGEAPADMAGGVYYTADSPGRWSGKAGSHQPDLEKKVGPDGSVVVTVTTNHDQNGYVHYIVKHQLLDGDYRFIAETMFDPNKDEPESSYTLPPGYKGMVYALSLCNKHDLWLNGMEV